MRGARSGPSRKKTEGQELPRCEKPGVHLVADVRVGLRTARLLSRVLGVCAGAPERKAWHASANESATCGPAQSPDSSRASFCGRRRRTGGAVRAQLRFLGWGLSTAGRSLSEPVVRWGESGRELRPGGARSLAGLAPRCACAPAWPSAPLQSPARGSTVLPPGTWWEVEQVGGSLRGGPSPEL